MHLSFVPFFMFSDTVNPFIKHLHLHLPLLTKPLNPMDSMDINITPKWEYVADNVMGGISQGKLSTELVEQKNAIVLRGEVSLENNGGFVQIATDLQADGSVFDASRYSGLELDLYGNNEAYDIRLRTSDLTRPWQSFRTEVLAKPFWQSLRLPFNRFSAHRTDAMLDTAQLRRLGIIAIGREFSAMVAVSDIRYYCD